MKSITELRRIAEQAEKPKPNGHPDGDANYEFECFFSPSTALALLEDWVKMWEALEIMPELIEVLEGEPDISDITQFTNEIYEAKRALASLKFKKGGV